MSGLETYGGKCPICGKGMLQKYESSYSGYMFDACPWCGYVNSNKEDLKDINQSSNLIKDKNEVLKDNIIDDWNSILSAFQCTNREELIKNCDLPEERTEEDSEFYPTLLEVKEDELKAIQKAVEELKQNNLI